jgi:Spy/CpxP family protein refolding chaperone
MRNRSFPCPLLLVIVLSLLACGGNTDAGSGQPGAPSETLPASPTGGDEGTEPQSLPEEYSLIDDLPEINVEGTVEFIWWNQEIMIEELELRPEQRQKMDAELRAYLSQWPQMQGTRKRARPALVRALRSRDFDTARRIVAEFREALDYVETGQMELKIQVFEILDQDQVDKIVNEQQFLLKRPWIKAQRISLNAGG